MHTKVPFISDHTSKLQEMLKAKEEILSWNIETQEAYEHLKVAITNAPTLHLLSARGKLIITTDASDNSVAATLWQENENKDIQMISTTSKRLTTYQRDRYNTFLKELLAIKMACHQWHNLIINKEFLIKTDNQSLSKMLMNSNSKLAKRWAMELLDVYTFKIEHISGHENVIPDLLSRTENEQTLKLDQICLKVHKVENKNLIAEVHEYTGHASTKLMIAEFQHRQITWKGMSKDIQNYIKTCEKCQQYNPQHLTQNQKHIVSNNIGEILQVDVLHMESDKSQKKYILTTIDHFSNYLIVHALKENNAKEICEALEYQFLTSGSAKMVHTDNSTEFMNQEFKKFQEKWKFEHKLSTAYRPQGHGKVERYNGLIRMIFNKLDVNDQWSKHLKQVENILNRRINIKTGITPYYLYFGRHPNQNQSIEIIEETNLNLDDIIQDRIDKIEDFVKKVGVISKMNSQKNQNLKEDKKIPKNTQVYYRNNLRSGKQEPRFIGPATIKNIIDGKYQLLDVLNHEIPNLFSRDQLKTTMVMNEDHKYSHIKKIHSRNEQNEYIVEFENDSNLYVLKKEDFTNKSFVNKFDKQWDKKHQNKKTLTNRGSVRTDSLF